MYGYYIFLGRGDWGTSREQSWDPTFRGNVATRLLGDWGPHRQGTPVTDATDWTTAWSPETWKRHLDFLADELGADTIVVCMNGYELPYPSTAFPEAVELDHRNVQQEYFQEVIDHGRKRGLTFNASFCTTGHAVGYAAAHPHCTTINAQGQRHRENLCHHHPEARRYVETVIREMLGRYHGFAGLSFHPPENAEPCCCQYCQDAYQTATGTLFADATDAARRDFYWQSCLRFQRDMEALGTSLIPGAQLYSITIPGRFEEDFALIGKEIPTSTILMHWDYWSFRHKLPILLRSLDVYRSQGHRLLFIPSSGWSLDPWDSYGQAVVEQIDAVKRHGVHDIIYFLGAIWHEESLKATSWHRHQPGR